MTRREDPATFAIESALRSLVTDPRTRDRALAAIADASASDDRPERTEREVLARINQRQLSASLNRLEEEKLEFSDLADDSERAHRQAADIQRVLVSLGFEVGPTGVDGYIGGPPGRPVTLSLDEASTLVEEARPGEKVLDAAAGGETESWTRDATRRLQTFLGTVGLPDAEAELRTACLLRPDGLFGARTLAGVRAFLTDVA